MRTIPLLIITALFSMSVQTQELKMAATEWCPYTCDNKNAPGILSEYLMFIMAKRNIQVSVEILPWTRAVARANSFDIDGLATFIIGESNDLVHTTSPTMTHQNCFFTRPSSTWTYHTIADLSRQRVGVVKNYGYDSGVMDEYIAKAPENSPYVQVISDHDQHERLLNMLFNDRLDTYLNDPYVMDWQKKHMQGDIFIRNAGCLEPTPLYWAFNKNLPGVNDLLDWLNAELLNPSNIEMRKLIEKKYQ